MTTAAVLEIEKPIEGIFVLGRSVLDGDDTLAAPGESGLQWERIECDATHIQVTRGGSNAGVGTSIEVGTLNASFVDGANPLDDADFRPGVGLRLSQEPIPVSLDPGALPTSWGYDPFTPEYYAYWDIDEPGFATRVAPMALEFEARLSVPATVEVSFSTPTRHVASRTEVEADVWTPIRAVIPATALSGAEVAFLAAEDDGTVETRNLSANIYGKLWAGKTDNFSLNFDKGENRSFVSLLALDAVASLAGTQRFGAATAAAEGEPWTDRFARLLQSSSVPFVAPTEINPFDLIWARTGDQDNGEWSGTWGTSGTSLVSTFTDGTPTTRTFTGLTPGRMYAVNTRWADHDVPMTATTNANEVFNETLAGSSRVRFFATATSHTLTVDLPSGYAYVLYEVSLSEVQFIPWAANNVHESDLASHLDIAANSAGVGWYVNREGIVRVVELTGEPVANFSDVHDDEDPAHVCYTQAAITYDTNDVVNGLALNNHARAWDEDQGAWQADDSTLGPFLNLASAATWGERKADLETAIFTGTDEWGFGDHADRVAADALAIHATPEVVIHSITFNANDYPEIAATLDIHSEVNLTHKGVDQPSAVIGMSHQIGVEDWFITLTLRRTT